MIDRHVMQRRDFLRVSGALAGGALLGSSLWRSALASVSRAGLSECEPTDTWPYGPLRAPDENGIMLPEGFSSRVIARSMEPVAGTDYVWHIYPDGGATFPAPDGGWIYVSNS